MSASIRKQSTQVLTLFFPFAVLVAFQLAGEALMQGFGLPVPGAVAGAVLLLAALFLLPGFYDKISGTCHLIIKNMLLFFVPISVGLMEQGPSLKQNLWLMIVAVCFSTWLTALVTASAFQWIERRAR